MGLDALKDFKKKQEEKDARRAEAEANKLTWFKVEDGETVYIQLLQELDTDSPNYSKANGIGKITTEHTKPGGGNNFLTNALCTGDDGEPCRACEEHIRLNRAKTEDYVGGWKAKNNLLVNVLVDKGKKDEEPFVAVLKRSVGNKAVVGKTIIDVALDEDNEGVVTNRRFKISRKGKGQQDTNYTITPQDSGKNIVNPEDYTDQLQDLEKAYRSVDYDDQEEFYGFSEPTAAREDSSGPSVDDDENW